MRKHRGNGSYISALLVIVVISSLVVYSAHHAADAEKSRAITAIMRQYVMIMESNGCLTAVEQQRLVMELEQCGVSEITFLSDPLVKVAYGGEVVLSISGKVDALAITGYEDFKLVRREDGLNFSKTLKSTAQY